MTSTIILNYALRGIVDDLSWITPPWNSAEIRQQRQLTKLRAKVKRKLVKLRLKAQSKYIDFARIDPLVYLHHLRHCLPDVYKRDRRAAHRQRSIPLPLP